MAQQGRSARFCPDVGVGGKSANVCVWAFETSEMLGFYWDLNRLRASSSAIARISVRRGLTARPARRDGSGQQG
jgi:hypothetical protein